MDTESLCYKPPLVSPPTAMYSPNYIIFIYDLVVIVCKYSLRILNGSRVTSFSGLFDLQFLLRLRLVKTESHKKTPRGIRGENDHEEEYIRVDNKL